MNVAKLSEFKVFAYLSLATLFRCSLLLALINDNSSFFLKRPSWQGMCKCSHRAISCITYIDTSLIRGIYCGPEVSFETCVAIKFVDDDDDDDDDKLFRVIWLF